MEPTLPPIGFILQDQIVDVDADGNVGDCAPPVHEHSPHTSLTPQHSPTPLPPTPTATTSTPNSTLGSDANTDSPTSTTITSTSNDNISHNDTNTDSDAPFEIRVRSCPLPPTIPAHGGLKPTRKPRNRRRIWRLWRQARLQRAHDGPLDWRTCRRLEREQCFVPLHQGQSSHVPEPLAQSDAHDVPAPIPRTASSSSEDDSSDASPPHSALKPVHQLSPPWKRIPPAAAAMMMTLQAARAHITCDRLN